jgi:hypothetical protein
MKKLIVEEVDLFRSEVRAEAQSNQSRQCVSQFRFILGFRLICLLSSCRSPDDILASPIRDGAPADGTTSGYYSAPQQGGVGAGSRPASPVIDDPSADLERELAGTHIGRPVIDGRVAGVKSEMKDDHVSNKVQSIADQLDHVNRSLSLRPLLHILRFRPLHRKPAQGTISTMAFALRSIHQS